MMWSPYRAMKFNGFKMHFLIFIPEGERKDYVSLINNLGLAGSSSESVKFNEEVKAQCLELKDRSLVGINNPAFKAMMNHWLKHYAEKKIEVK